MKLKYKKPSLEFFEFISEDIITASGGEVVVPTGTTKPLTDVVVTDPFDD